MKNNIKNYKNLTKEEKKFLREFDKAIELGMFDNKLIKFPKKMKSEIINDRNKFRNDLMYKGKRKGDKVDHLVLDEKPHIGKKKTKSARDKSGKFVKKDEQ